MGAGGQGFKWHMPEQQCLESMEMLAKKVALD